MSFSSFKTLALTGILWAIASPDSSYGQADYKRYYDEDKLPKVHEIFQMGRYDIVLQICDYALRRGQPSWEWRSLRMKSLAQTGKYEDAITEATEMVSRFPRDLGALLEAYQMYQITGRKKELDSTRGLLNAAAGKIPGKDRSGLDLVRMGQAALILGADPQKVIQNYFIPAKAQKAKGQIIPPGLVEAYQASGELALRKNDYKLAADEFRAALKLAPTDPDLRFGLARAYLPSDRKKGLQLLKQNLDEATVHFGTLLLLAEYEINFEQFDAARQYLNLVLGINPRQPTAHAYLAVIENLEKNNPATFEQERKLALSLHPQDPFIDHLIGRVLSRNYRFQEGADAQLRALAFDPDYLPAQLQLGLDYLRLGNEEKAWLLANEVSKADTYDVLAYNLEILQKEIADFKTMTSPDFIIRMPENEAAIYGDRVLEILNEAKQVLGRKYAVDLKRPVLVEFFPSQSDFAIRSFGSLGGAGLLGVCFGTVITMNSPGSLSHGKNNWEATLWHEFCHVITLNATKNKMPRWLSEGISVYEEIQRNPNWGQRMTPQYRGMILEDSDLTPISELSQAFYNAKSGQHIMFAYYESMLVVKYIVKNFGQDALKGILTDLSEGVLINDSIARNTAPIEKLEEGFAAYVVNLAKNLAPRLDWSRPGPEVLDPSKLKEVSLFVKKNPQNFWARKRYTELLLNDQQWSRAASAAGELIDLYPDYVEAGNGYQLQARAFRESGQVRQEEAVLERLAARSSEAYQAYSRLLALCFKEKNWTGVTKNAQRALAINPFLREIYYDGGHAYEALSQADKAIQSFEKLLKLNPVNPSETLFRLAKLWRRKDALRSKRYLLDALADSPRFQEAHRFLLEIEEDQAPSSQGKEIQKKSP